MKKTTARKLSKDSFPCKHTEKTTKNLIYKNTRGTSLDDNDKKDKDSLFVSAIFIDELDCPQPKINENFSIAYERLENLLSKYKNRCESLKK